MSLVSWRNRDALSNQSLHVMVDGCRSKLVNVATVPKGSVWGSLLTFFFILKYKLIGYADYFTLIAVTPSPVVRVAVAETTNRNLGKVILQLCNLRRIKLNTKKTKTMLVSMSRTIHLRLPQ